MEVDIASEKPWTVVSLREWELNKQMKLFKGSFIEVEKSKNFVDSMFPDLQTTSVRLANIALSSRASRTP